MEADIDVLLIEYVLDICVMIKPMCVHHVKSFHPPGRDTHMAFIDAEVLLGDLIIY